MYLIDYLEKIWDAVEDKVISERMRYIKIYETIEKYISGSDILIGGSISIDLLLKSPRTLDDFFYELYSENPFLHANNLANEIDALGQESRIGTVFLKNTIPNIKYQIFVDNRPMVVIYRLSENSVKIMSPVRIQSFSGPDIMVVPPEIHLIDVYRILSSPNKADDWEEALYIESRLFSRVKSRIPELKTGSGDRDPVSPDDRKKVELEILKKFVSSNKNTALIGEHAIRLLIKSDITVPVIQLISQSDTESDFLEIEKIIRTTLGRNIPVLKLTRDLHIMQDYRIRRTTIKMGSEEKEVVYIYNIAEYDLVPVNRIFSSDSEFLQIGNPFVLLRFLLIDYWMILWVRGLGSIDEKFAKLREDSILSKFIELRNSITAELKTGIRKRNITVNPKFFDSLEVPGFRVFPSQISDYIGVFDDELISQKIMIMGLQKKFYDYYPGDYKNKFGRYRDINASE